MSAPKDEIACTVSVPGQLPSACNAPAVAIVQTAGGTRSEPQSWTEPLGSVPPWAIWTGHAVCERHRHTYKVVRGVCTTTLTVEGGV